MRSHRRAMVPKKACNLHERAWTRFCCVWTDATCVGMSFGVSIGPYPGNYHFTSRSATPSSAASFPRDTSHLTLYVTNPASEQRTRPDSSVSRLGSRRPRDEHLDKALVHGRRPWSAGSTKNCSHYKYSRKDCGCKDCPDCKEAPLPPLPPEEPWTKPVWPDRSPPSDFKGPFKPNRTKRHESLPRHESPPPSPRGPPPHPKFPKPCWCPPEPCPPPPCAQTGYIIDVKIPRGVRPGDQLSVCIPARAGGGSVIAIVPAGARKGDVMEVEV